MLGELANNNNTTTGANNHCEALLFALPADIDNLIDACETYSPIDVWMKYLATLPLDTAREELHRIKPLFIEAVTEYMGVDE